MEMQPPPGGDMDRGPELVAIYWVESAIAILIVSLRMIGRLMIHQTGMDDYVMLFTLLLFLILAAFVTYYASIDGCRHLYYLTAPQRLQAVKYNWVTQPWGIFGFATGKISVALLILRLIGPNTKIRKWVLYTSIISVFVINALGCIFTFVQCSPARALWHPELLESGRALCWDPSIQSNYAIFLSTWNVLIDIVLAVLPVTIFWNLKISIRKKIALCFLLGLGLVAAICGIVKIRYLAGLNSRSDLTWETYNLFAWSGAELFVIIVCGSVPPIKPLWDRLVGRRLASTAGYSNSYGSYPQRGNNGQNSSHSGQNSRGIAVYREVVDDTYDLISTTNMDRKIIRKTDIQVLRI